jgi:general secretion pathway protein I
MSRSPASERAGERGFSLIEVMCAVAIMAFALVALYRGAGQSQHAAQYMETHFGARLVARSLIEDVRQSPTAGAEWRQGDSGQYHWQVVIEQVNVPGVAGLHGYRFFHVQALVTWQPNGQFSLDALKLGR